MATKKSGKCYEYVKAELEKKGVPGIENLKIATLGRGSDHLIVTGDDVIGSYNHRSHEIFLYSEAFGENNVRTIENIKGE